MKYLTGEEILVIHSRIIEETGGSQGIRDTGLFLSVLEKPRMALGNKEFYPGVFEKAASYLEGLAKYHVFVDGNKRTAFASASRFLFINNYFLHVSNQQVVKFMLKVINDKLEIRQIASWLRKYSKKI